MNKLRNMPEVAETDVWMYDLHHGHRGHRVPILDDEQIDDRKALYWDEGVDVDGHQFLLVHYRFNDGFTRLAAMSYGHELSYEDWAEWEAATNGENYYRA